MKWRIGTVLPHLRGRVLDLGCGTNELLRHYRAANGDPRASQSVGVDVFDWSGPDLIVADSSRLPWEDGSFDTVSIVAALNHIPNRQRALRECRRLVRPAGRIVITMLPPNLSRLWHLLRKPWDADQVERGMQPGEVWGLTRRQVEDLMLEAGFEPVSHSRFMLGLNLLTIGRAVQPARVEAMEAEDRPALRPVSALAAARSNGSGLPWLNGSSAGHAPRPPRHLAASVPAAVETVSSEH